MRMRRLGNRTKDSKTTIILGEVDEKVALRTLSNATVDERFRLSYGITPQSNPTDAIDPSVA